jgi:hypothetical protein
MNDEVKKNCSYFIVHHSSFIISLSLAFRRGARYFSDQVQIAIFDAERRASCAGDS